MKSAELIAHARNLSTKELETLIADLLEVRANMAPAVPITRPQPGDLEDVNISMQDDPSIEARRLKDGRIRLWMRNAGIGWLAFNLSIENGITLREYLIANTDQDRMPALLGNGGGEGNTAH